MRRRKALAALAAVVAIAATAASAARGPQGPMPARPPVGAETVRVTLHQVDFLAVDRRGRPLTDIARNEVRVWEDGVEQEITVFLPAHEPASDAAAPPGTVTSESGPAARALESGRPPAVARRWVLFLFDARNLSAAGLGRAAAAVADLVRGELTPSDRAALLVDDDEMRFVVPFTTRHAALIDRLSRPGRLAQAPGDPERRLRDLRDNAESCREAPAIVDCARQAATDYLAQAEAVGRASLDHLEALLRGLSAIPDRKILFYVSEGFNQDPGDVAQAAVEHAIGQHGYSLSGMRSFLTRDLTARLESLYRLAAEARVGFYPVNTWPWRADDLFSAERTQGFGPDNPAQARTDVFEASWEQSRALQEDLARTTGGVPLFRRDPKGHLEKPLQAARGVYSIAYVEPDVSEGRRRVRIELTRPGAKALYREWYRRVVPDRPVDLPGRLVVAADAWDPATRRLPVTLTVGGAGFAPTPGEGAPVAIVSLFFEVRDTSHRPVQDLHQVIALPQAATDPSGAAELTYPFELRLPAGAYSLHVTLRDINGPLRGTYAESFSVPAAAGASAGPS